MKIIYIFYLLFAFFLFSNQAISQIQTSVTTDFKDGGYECTGTCWKNCKHLINNPIEYEICVGIYVKRASPNNKSTELTLEKEKSNTDEKSSNPVSKFISNIKNKLIDIFGF